MNNYFKSEYESDFLGLNIFRCTGNKLPHPNEIRKYALENKVDLFRLKIDAKFEGEMNEVLEKCCMPFFYSHSVLNVKVDYSKQLVAPYKNEGLSFEAYEGKVNQVERFYKLVYEGMYDDPIGYYKTPLVAHLIPKDKEAACYASYYTKLYDGSNKNNIGFIMKKNEVDVGAFVFEIINGEMYTSMAAVLSQYRSSGLFHDMKVFRQQYCIDNNITIAYTGSRLSNYHTPSVLLKNGYNIYNAEHVFHISPLANNNVLNTNIKPEPNCRVKSNNLQNFLFDWLKKYSNVEINHLLQNNAFSVQLNYNSPSNRLLEIKGINIPLLTESVLVIVFFYSETKSQTTSFGYMKLFVHD